MTQIITDEIITLHFLLANQWGINAITNTLFCIWIN